MKKFIHAIRVVRQNIINVLHSFTRYERILFVVFSFMFLIGALGLVISIDKIYGVSIPVQGGSYTEGMIGTPRFINPVLAKTNTDKDLARLVYSGLMRETQGKLINDLAESYTVSADKKTYTFTLKNNITFHDKEPITTEDVVFTVEKIKDSTIDSPLYVLWQNVIHVEALDNKTVQFTLDKPYAGFLQTTTVGILPKHLWLDTPFAYNEQNNNAIGSGPYRITHIRSNKTGTPESITLRAFHNFALGEPFIKKIHINFYANNDALLNDVKKNKLDGAQSIDPADAHDLLEQENMLDAGSPMTRVFGIFFNANEQTIFLDSDVITAINDALNKNVIIERALFGFGEPLDSPLPPGTPGYEPFVDTFLTKEERTEQASALLARAGWTMNTETGIREKNGTPLSFSLSVNNTPELQEVAVIIQDRLKEIGITMDIQIFETGNFEQDVLRPRNYDAVLSAYSLQHDTDLYAFWHSSRRNDPGLNISSFTNSDADNALKSAIEENDPLQRATYYQKLSTAIQEKPTAIFLYSPHFIFITKPRIQGVSLGSIRSSADRFNTIYTWFVEEERLWRP